ncbi:hypothetical protein BH24ACT26_BH24ACT26_09590 [soil metagenome]
MRTAPLVAWSLCGVLVALLAASNVLSAANGSLGEGTALFTVAFVAVGSVGSLIAARRPDNRIGWLLIGIMLAMSITFVGDGYAAYALETRPGFLPGGAWAGWVSNWLWLPAIASFLSFLPLLFPDGRLPSPRWRPFAWLLCSGIAFAGIVLALQPRVELDQAVSSIPNPIGRQWAGGVATWVDGPGGLVFLALALVSGMSLIQRYRQGLAAQRQQIKWFLFAMGLLMAYFVVIIPLEVAGAASPGDTVPGRIAAVGAILAVPVAIGIAILKHRLYDIDLIINRALVYACLTAMLALVYIAGVFGVGGLFRELTSGEESNGIVVAGSTLAVAAAFRPARARLQRFIDRRFYRHKYDAEQTLADFSARLRDEIDLDTLNTELLTVVRETMHPTHLSLWLRTHDAPLETP